MRTAVVILNWNTRQYLLDFLPGIVGSCRTVPGAEVIVADSGSTDGSLDALAEHFPEVKTIPLGENYGFTGGYNRAIEALMKEHQELEYVVLLNSDIEVDEGWLSPLVEWMDGHPGCAACGPKLHALDKTAGGYERTSRFEYAGAAGGYLDMYGFPFCRGRVLGLVDEDRGQFDSPKDVFWVSGACMMVRAGVWKVLGGLDDRFFAHMEEIDFCWRAQRKGWKVTVVPASTVWHLGGGTLPKTSPFKLKLNFRNNMLMLEKNLPASAGKWRAGRRLRLRKLINLGAAAVYFLTGRKEMARSVMEARKEAAAMKPKGSVRYNGSADVVPKGYFRLCLLPLYALKGKKIFNYLERYENSH